MNVALSVDVASTSEAIQVSAMWEVSKNIIVGNSIEVNLNLRGLSSLLYGDLFLKDIQVLKWFPQQN